MNKSINNSPLPIKKWVLFIAKSLRKHCLLICTGILFFICYKLTFYIFTNSYIIHNFFEGKGYSETCLNLVDDKKLLYELDDFYNISYKNKDYTQIPPIFFNNVPTSFKEVTVIEIRKRIFLNMILPILLKVEQEIIEERKKILELSVKIVQVPLVEQDFIFLEGLVSKYRISMNEKNFWNYSLALEELIKRVDIIPTSLALAMAGKETGWGTSRFLIEGNSLFSEHTSYAHMGMKANESNAIVRKFATLEGAVRSYYYNINTSGHYSKFRGARASMRMNDKKLDSVELSQELVKYSEETHDYIRDLAVIIRVNNLFKFDGKKSFNENNSICVDVI